MANTITKLLASSAMVAFLAGCESTGGTQDGSTDVAVDPAAEQQPQAEGAAIGAGINEQNFDQALIEQTTVYFDFDRDTIKPEYKELLDAHAALMASSSTAKVVVEGHGDERGTVEYNLALGERRAKSVRRYLLAKGAQPNQIETVSFGEERPVENASNEAAWSKNRRAELKYQSK